MSMEQGASDRADDTAAVVAALSGQVASLLPQLRGVLDEDRYRDLSGHVERLRQDLTGAGRSEEALARDKAWLDETLAHLLGLAQSLPRP
jgi:hypothetical protein